MTDTSQPLFLFGPGYCARALAAIWHGPVHAFKRQPDADHKPKDVGTEPVPTPKRDQLRAETCQSHILISAPPNRQGCPGLQMLGEVVDEAASVTYLSTTGVYGDLRGGWAFEDTPVAPRTERAKLRVAAERAWRDLYPNVRIVRLPGIYGPGRSALDRISAGQARRVVKPGQVYSRAHVDDIAGGLKALMTSGHTGVFHLSDDEAAPPQDVTGFAADLLGVQPPPCIAIEAAGLSPMAESFYGECKRVSNAKLKAATGWRPKYPSYREGLSAILDSENR